MGALAAAPLVPAVNAPGVKVDSPEDAKRRLGFCSISPEFVVEMLHYFGSDGKERPQAFVNLTGIPKGAEYVRAWHDPKVDVFNLVFRHSSFPISRPGSELTRFHATARWMYPRKA